MLNEKRNAVYYHGSQAVLNSLDVRTAATDTGKTTIMVNGTAETGNSFVYKMGTELTTVAYDTVLSDWTALSTNPLEVSAAGNTVVQVAEVDSSNKAKAVGSAVINAG